LASRRGKEVKRRDECTRLPDPKGSPQGALEELEG